jgi:ketosteroid isomerase-like protein
MMVHCAPELTSFDLVPPLRHEGPEAIRRIWANTLAGLKRPIDFDQHYLELFVGDEVAFARSINRFGGTQRSGEHTVSWLCSTTGFKRISGRWRLIHQHVSVPFDMDSGKALLGLEP